MAFVKLEDIIGDECELVVFPSVFKETADIWVLQRSNLKGKVNGKDKNGGQIIEPKIIVDEANAVSIKEAKEYQPKVKSCFKS